MITRRLSTVVILLGLAACAQATPELLINPTPLLVQDKQTETQTVLEANTTVTPLPTQLAGILKHWKDYEIALGQKMLASFSPDEVICEWEVLGEAANELYVWVACTTTVPNPGTADSYPQIHTVAVIHLDENDQVIDIEQPRPGNDYANDIRALFSEEAQEKFFSGSYDQQRLTDNLLLRRDNHYISPVVVQDAARSTPTPAPTFTYIESDLPEGLMVVFTIDDTIQIWKEGELQEVFTGSSIFGASLSPDAKWIKFYQSEDQFDPTSEIWAVRTDGTDLRRLLSREQLTSLAEDDTALILDQIEWLPKSHQLVFNTQELTEGPQGYLPAYDLYLLDISGEITQVAGPGEGGDFYPSPDGRYIAAAIPSRIGLFDLVTGAYNILLEFESIIGPIGPPRPPLLYWDKDSQFITTSILPKDVYYPYMYGGEPEQIWRLGIDGKSELIVEVEPHPGYGFAVRFSPHAKYYFYFEAGACPDGAERILHLHSSMTGEEILEIPCTFAYPEWTPDDEHFIYREAGKWVLGNVDDAQTKHLDILDLPLESGDYPTIKIQWIDQSYYLQEVSNSAGCSLYLGSLDGIITEILHTSGPHCSGSSIIKDPDRSCTEADFPAAEEQPDLDDPDTLIGYRPPRDWTPGPDWKYEYGSMLYNTGFHVAGYQRNNDYLVLLEKRVCRDGETGGNRLTEIVDYIWLSEIGNDEIIITNQDYTCCDMPDLLWDRRVFQIEMFTFADCGELWELTDDPVIRTRFDIQIIPDQIEPGYQFPVEVVNGWFPNPDTGSFQQLDTEDISCEIWFGGK